MNAKRTNNRFCVFCGHAPENKNREHVLPQWLLEFTGDPKRVVNFGTNFENNSTIKFDWSSFCVPACKRCNDEFSSMESRAKKYVIRLINREPLSSIEYSDFMDWLDKVRIGIWIAYHLIQKNPTEINPKFHIKTRICKKDRMIAIYPLTGNGIGLNAIGAESLIFHSQPSCFALRINNLLILNISSDYLFSARCGFPFPKKMYTTLDGANPNLLQLEDFQTTHRIKHPLIRRTIAKPSIHLYQPIMTSSDNKRFQSGFLGNYNLFDSYLAEHTLPPYPSGKGVLFFQHQDRVDPILDIERPIKFENIESSESKSMYELCKQVYELQTNIYENNEYRSENINLLNSHLTRKKKLIKWNKFIISNYTQMINELEK